MSTNVINLLNRVPEHDSLTFFVLHRIKCKPMHFEWERFSDLTLTTMFELGTKVGDFFGGRTSCVTGVTTKTSNEHL